MLLELKAKAIAKRVLPKPWVDAISRVRNSFHHDTIMLSKRSLSYAEDGLYTIHGADFLRDAHFERAYALGKNTGSWEDAELHWRVYIACWAAQRAAKLKGDFVETGVYQGGLARAIFEYVGFDKLDKTFWLVDTFRGIPDNFAAEAGPTPIYRDSYEAVKETFRPFPNAKLIRGIVPDVLPEVKTAKVAYLSIDMNTPAPELATLEYFWDKLVPGAAVVLDDYNYVGYERQRVVEDRFADSKSVQVLALPTGQGVIFKP